MSTRGIIARTTPDSFEGTYHHFDSYPDGLGAALYSLYNGHFQKDAKAMTRVLVDEHRGGWSTIVSSDFTLEPGFREHGPLHSEYKNPRCYCHGDRHEGPYDLIKMHEEGTGGAEYAYAIDEESAIMYCFAHEYSNHKWRLFAEVNLNGPEPDWESLEEEDEEESED